MQKLAKSLKVEKFNNSGDVRFEEWINEFEMWMEMQRVPPEFKTEALIMHLGGPVRRWANSQK